MATDARTSTLAAAVTAGTIPTGDLNFAQAASGLVSPDGTQSMFLTNGGGLVTAAGAGIADTVETLTDGTTVTWAWDKQLNTAQVTLAGNRTLAITGATIGMRGILKVIQDATGSRTLTYPTTTVKVGTPLTTTASAADFIEFVYVATNTFWMVTDTKNVS